MITTSSSLARASRGITVLVGLVFIGVVLAACGSSSSPTAGTTTTTSAASTRVSSRSLERRVISKSGVASGAA